MVSISSFSFWKDRIRFKFHHKISSTWGNDTGAKQYSFSYFYQRVKGYNKLFEMVNKNFKQAESFYLTYKSELTAEMLGDIEHYIELKTSTSLKEYKLLISMDF